MDIYQQKPELFHLSPIQKTLGLNTYSLKDLSDHCEEHVLLVIIDGYMRGISNALVLEGDE